jgi:uncharacterized protein YfcZ (UPF0381/DUF406 family)
LASILLNSAEDEKAEENNDKTKANNHSGNYEDNGNETEHKNENKNKIENENENEKEKENKDGHINDNDNRIIDKDIVYENEIKNEKNLQNITDKEKNKKTISEKMKNTKNSSLLSGLFSFFIDNILVIYFIFLRLPYYEKLIPLDWMATLINLNYKSYTTIMTIKLLYTYITKKSKIQKNNSMKNDENCTMKVIFSNKNSTISDGNKDSLAAYCMIVTLTLFLTLAYVGITFVNAYV